MKKLIALVSIIMVISAACMKEQASSVVFMVENKSESDLIHLQLRSLDGNAKTKETAVPSGQTIIIRLYLDQVNGDGCYILNYKTYTTKTNSHQYSFGYYTNGQSLNNEIKISLLRDTVIINSKKN